MPDNFMCLTTYTYNRIFFKYADFVNEKYYLFKNVTTMSSKEQTKLGENTIELNLQKCLVGNLN